MRHRKRHEAVLKLVEGVSSPQSLIARFEKLRKQRNWKLSTTLTYVGTLFGAARSPFVTSVVPQLGSWLESRRFENYCKSLRTQVLSETVNFPKAATREMVTALIAKASSVELKVVLILLWTFAARLSDLLKLRVCNVNVNGRVVMAKWVEGKGVSARQQAFTTAAVIPLPYAEMIKSHLTARAYEHHVWPEHDWKTIRQELATLWKKKGLEARSFRRGSLQTMAMAGATERTLRFFSHHATEETLMRYLSWGWFHQNQHVQTTHASQALWPQETSHGHA